VKGFFGGFRSSVDNDGTGALQYWKDWADTNLPLLQTLFNNIIGAIQRLWEIFGPAIQAITDTAFGNIWTVIDTTMRNIGDAITLALQLLTGDFEGAKGTLEDIIQRTWDAIYGIFSNTLDTIRDLITNIDWWGMGSAIIDGIADGIRGAAGRIAEAAESAARRAYNAAKSWLGIHSPSKRFEELGEYSGEGWSVGFDGFISSAAARIDSSLAGVMSDLSPTPAGAGSVSGLGPVSITINLTGNATYENGRLVGRGVLDELRAQGAL
jgi:phage-related protein